MPASNKTMIHKLLTAINMNGGRVLYDRVQFFSREQNRPITLYKINEIRDKKRTLFETASQIQVVMFLRDYWFIMQGKELPTGQKEWVNIRERKQFDWTGAKLLYKQIEERKEKVRMSNGS